VSPDSKYPWSGENTGPIENTGPKYSTPRVFGLWRMYFPPVLVRTDRRLLV